MKVQLLAAVALLAFLLQAAADTPPADLYQTEHYTKSCCQFSKADHTLMSNWHQLTQDGSELPAGAQYQFFSAADDNCGVCPPYTCRSGHRACVTPEAFLENARYREPGCEDVFGAAWPQSAVAPLSEDIQLRGCDPTVSPPEDIYKMDGYTKSCCQLTKSEHDLMLYWHQAVNDGNSLADIDHEFHLGEPCVICPAYTCRNAHEACVTPEAFLLKPTYREDGCAEKFGSAWPQSAADSTAEDIDVRGCAPMGGSTAGSTPAVASSAGAVSDNTSNVDGTSTTAQSSGDSDVVGVPSEPTVAEPESEDPPLGTPPLQPSVATSSDRDASPKDTPEDGGGEEEGGEEDDNLMRNPVILGAVIGGVCTIVAPGIAGCCFCCKQRQEAARSVRSA